MQYGIMIVAQLEHRIHTIMIATALVMVVIRYGLSQDIVMIMLVIQHAIFVKKLVLSRINMANGKPPNTPLAPKVAQKSENVVFVSR